MDGTYSQKTVSRTSPIDLTLGWWEALLLISSGVTALVRLGDLAHVTKPLGQPAINLMTGWPFGSFRFGIVYPFAGHLLFGMIGGLLCALVVSGIRRYSQKSPQ
jgi:membrane associated rhomboid family serine protease